MICETVRLFPCWSLRATPGNGSCAARWRCGPAAA